MTLKEYTNSRRLSYQAAYHYAVVMGDVNGFLGHINKEKGILVLDDDAVSILDKHFNRPLKKKEAKEAVVLNKEFASDSSEKKTVRVKTVMLSDLNKKEERLKAQDAELSALEREKKELSDENIRLRQSVKSLQAKIVTANRNIDEEKNIRKALESQLQSCKERLEKFEREGVKTPDEEKWVTISQYANSEKITYEAARKKVEMYAKDLADHIKEVPYGKGKRTVRMLDEYACSKLSEHTIGLGLPSILELRKFELETLFCYAIFNKDKDSIRALVNWIMEQLVIKKELNKELSTSAIIKPVDMMEKNDTESAPELLGKIVTESDSVSEELGLPFEILEY